MSPVFRVFASESEIPESIRKSQLWLPPKKSCRVRRPKNSVRVVKTNAASNSSCGRELESVIMTKFYASRFPPENSITHPLLVFIHLSGGEFGAVKCERTYEPLANFFGLHDGARRFTRHDRTGGGDTTPVWHNKIQFARQRLIEEGYLQKSRRGVWQASSSGRKAASRLVDQNPLQWGSLYLPGLALSEGEVLDANHISLEDLGL